MTAAVDNAKAGLRARMRALQATLDPAWAAAAGRNIVDRILALPQLQAASTIAAYYATPGEPNLDALIAQLLSEGKAVSVPAYDPAHNRYRLCAAGDAEPVPGRFGVREPAPPRWTPTPEPCLWLVPGVAFDRRGHRLGHGGGCYDRLLANSSGVRVGIAFTFQVLDEIAAEAHDVNMHLVITEREIHQP